MCLHIDGTVFVQKVSGLGICTQGKVESFLEASSSLPGIDLISKRSALCSNACFFVVKFHGYRFYLKLDCQLLRQTWTKCTVSR